MEFEESAYKSSFKDNTGYVTYSGMKASVTYQVTVGTAFGAVLVALEVREKGLLCLDDPFGNFCHNVLFQSVEAMICQCFAWIATTFSTPERHQFLFRR